MSNISSVKIRMYRHGFGDCFLLRFFVGEKLSFKMLIDCGLKHNDSVPGVPLGDVVDDIRSLVNEKHGTKEFPRLDVLVITHEHWDHVSAFKPERKLFDDFVFDNIWMSWTEDPKDKVAQQINAHLKDTVNALRIAGARMKKTTTVKKNAGFYSTELNGATILGIREKFNGALESIMDFYGPLAVNIETDSGITIKDKYKISVETQKAFDHIKQNLAPSKSALRYFTPGKLLEKIDGLPGVRMYILGPPKNELLNKDAPSSGPQKEVYLSWNNAAMRGFVSGVLKHAGLTENEDEGCPFSGVATIKPSDAKLKTFYKERYFNTNDAWRTIDEDWLEMAGSLALQMDNDTNNTSLALAIEMPDGRILLFPGDAQVGNWLSWHDHTWKVKEGSKTVEVTATDILSRTTFYKAGHHSSHNATLKEKGLELMEDENLVVFIPEKEDQYNGIPFSPLVDRLNEKAKGRVLFSADANFPAEEVLKTKPDNITKKDWTSFKKNITIEAHFIEYTLA